MCTSIYVHLVLLRESPLIKNFSLCSSPLHHQPSARQEQDRRHWRRRVVRGVHGAVAPRRPHGALNRQHCIQDRRRARQARGHGARQVEAPRDHEQDPRQHHGGIVVGLVGLSSCDA